jgi:hypothetical protein
VQRLEEWACDTGLLGAGVYFGPVGLYMLEGVWGVNGSGAVAWKGDLSERTKAGSVVCLMLT